MKSRRPAKTRRPWRVLVRDARRFVREARKAQGKVRYELVVAASIILVELSLRREPTKDRRAFERALDTLDRTIGGTWGCAGCLAERSMAFDRELYAHVERAVNKADPMGLLRLGAPPDEYHPEIDDIALRLPYCKTIVDTCSMVHRTFVKWFAASGVGSRASYLPLARELRALSARRPERARAAPSVQRPHSGQPS